MTTPTSDYDIVIIGGGVAGLYTAYKILKRSPKTNLLLVDRAERRDLGGRANNAIFQGVSVVTGAGIGRLEKDHLLKQWMHEFGLPIHTFQTQMSHQSIEGCDVKATFTHLQREYRRECKSTGNKIHVTFKSFATKNLGKSDYLKFITCSGYTDYENEDVYDTFYHYGFEDNYDEYTGFSVPWRKLVKCVADYIGYEHIMCSSVVKSIDPYPSGEFSVSIMHSGGRHERYTTDKVVIATTIDSLQKLVPVNKSLYHQIGAQPFLRLYGKFAKSSITILKDHLHGITALSGPLQKIIPMDPDKGVYMISYSDNKHAMFIKSISENTPKNRDHICRFLEEDLGISRGTLALLTIDDFYWEIGTHYFKPLKDPFKTRQEFIKKIQHPMPNLFVVGEAVSQHQGWVEGALESVEKVASKL